METHEVCYKITTICDFGLLTKFYILIATALVCLTTRDFATTLSICTTACTDDVNRLAFPEPFTKEWPKLHQQLSNQLKL